MTTRDLSMSHVKISRPHTILATKVARISPGGAERCFGTVAAPKNDYSCCKRRISDLFSPATEGVPFFKRAAKYGDQVQQYRYTGCKTSRNALKA